MASNDVGGIFVGRGMSRASKRAKERQNRSSDELVMAETRISRSQNLQVTDVRKGRMSGASDVRESRKSVNLVRVRGSGRPEKVGRPVVPGAPDVRKTPVVRWVGVNARCEFGGAILSGKWRFRGQNSRDFVDERWGNMGRC